MLVAGRDMPADLPADILGFLNWTCPPTLMRLVDVLGERYWLCPCAVFVVFFVSFFFFLEPAGRAIRNVLIVLRLPMKRATPCVLNIFHSITGGRWCVICATCVSDLWNS